MLLKGHAKKTQVEKETAKTFGIGTKTSDQSLKR